MKKYTTFIFLLIISFSTKAQSVRETIRLSDSLLTTGDHKVCLVTYRFPERIEALQQKAIDSLKHFKSKDVITSKLNLKLLQDGTSSGLHFRPEFGLTKPEFDTLLNAFMIRRKAVLGDTLSIHITNGNGFISFNAPGKLGVYDQLLINTKNEQVVYDGYLLTREEIAHGPYYAPTLEGYDLVFPVPIDKKRTNPFTGLVGFAIGRDKDNGRTTLILLFKPMLTKTNAVTMALMN
jgi:hypothetical protein